MTADGLRPRSYGGQPRRPAGRTFALDTTAVSALANGDQLTIPFAIDQVLPGLLTGIE